jgi:hypothetical protein
MAWKRQFWGIRFLSGRGKDEPFLIGSSWHIVSPERWNGEPTRALLTQTRKQAREIVKALYKKYGPHCPFWKFREVRVTEDVSESK